jgi:hypothetical protein
MVDMFPKIEYFDCQPWLENRTTYGRALNRLNIRPVLFWSQLEYLTGNGMA